MEHSQERHISETLKEKNIVLKGADPITTHGFTQVPNFLLRSASLSPGAKLAVAMLLSYAWQNDYCFPGQKRLAVDIGVTDRSVRTYLKELQDAGIPEVERRGLGKTNFYTIFLKHRDRG